MILELVKNLTARGQTLAVAESLTGGLLAAEVVSVSGASKVFSGGIVAYRNDLKAKLLDVSSLVLAEQGAVCAEVALQMAVGAQNRFGTDWAIATTGVAGPSSVDGVPVGTVFIAVVGPELGKQGEKRQIAQKFSFPGDRFNVRRATVEAAIELIIGEISRN
ncbi:MAG: CinA family protein [Arcanobacterium sp.]|nr:CinA family protein [Arcanobacterium sp.]